MATHLSADARALNPVSSLLRWLVQTLLVAAAFAGPAQAAVYTGVWDPAFGAPFTNLGWRGTADYYVPDTCVPAGTADLNNLTACAGGAAITSAQVEFYDINASGQPTISTLVFIPWTMQVQTLSFISGELTGLTSGISNLVNPAEDLSAYGVDNLGQYFGLFFDGQTGPRLKAYCNPFSDNTSDSNATSSFNATPPSTCVGHEVSNDATNYRPRFTITRVPEPGTLALACLALFGLAARRVRLFGR